MQTVSLAYTRSGKPGAPPLVLLHGLGGSASTWDEVSAELAEEAEIYAFDLRGHARSPWPGDYSFELMRDDVIGMLDELGLRRVTLVGHSMGGAVSYLVAEARPDLVGRLLLEDAPAPFPRFREPPPRPEEPLPFDWAAVLQMLKNLTDPPASWWERLAEIEALTVVLGGGELSHLPQDRIALMAERIPNARMITVPVGHLIHENAAGEFVRILRELLSSEL